jgi:cytoskeletal protein RodZ
LQTDPNSAEILASHESKEETQVLGSLMGLRYRDAHASFLRWSIIGIVFLVTLLAGGPLVWYRIPQGWRELIWQKISFTQPDSTTSLSTEPNTNPGSSTPAKPPDSTTTSPTPAETPTVNELSTKESL